MKMYRILIVEDDAAIAKGLVAGLAEEGFDPVTVSSGEAALDMLGREALDLVLLDIRLPGKNGFEVLKSIRSAGNPVPVIILTARDEEIDKVLGLEIGADDYMVKPFSFRELVGRIHARLRRSGGEFSFSGTGKKRIIGNLRVDIESLRVWKRDDEVPLTPLELKLLLYFIQREGVSVNRSMIIEQVWGTGYYLEDEHTVDVHIRHLREKIEDDPSSPRLIRTVRGFGYRFDTGENIKKS